METSDILLILCSPHPHPTLFSMANALKELARKPFYGRQAMERIMDVHPRYRKEAMLSERPIAKHLLREVTKLYIEA